VSITHLGTEVPLPESARSRASPLRASDHGEIGHRIPAYASVAFPPGERV